MANVESLESMPKSYIGSDAESFMNFPQTLIADAATLDAPVVKEAEISVTPPVADVEKVEEAAKAAAAEKLALEQKLAEIRSDGAKKKAEQVKSIDVTPSPTISVAERDKLIAEEEARIEAAKRAQIEKIYKEQEKARLAAEKDAEKARKELEQRAEKAAQKARADAEKKAIEAKVKSVKDREASTSEQAKLKYQEAEKAQAARLKAEESRRKLERESLDLNTSLEFLRQVEDAKKAEAKAADDIRIKAMEERIKLDQEIKQVKGREFDETMEDIALVAVPSAIIAGVVYTSGALKRESDYESNMIGRDPSSPAPYGMQDDEDSSGPFGMKNPFDMGNQEEDNTTPFEMVAQAGFPEQSSPPEATQSMQTSLNPPTENKSTFGGGGMPPKAKGAAAPFGKSPLKGSADKKSPFGGGGMPTAKTEGKTKAFGNVSTAPAFPAFQTPLKGRDTSGDSGKGSIGSSSTVFGKGPTKGSLETPPKKSSSPIPSAFEKTSQKGFVGGKNDAGSFPTPKSFGMPPKGSTEQKSPFGSGGGLPTKSGPAPTSLKGGPGMPPKSDSPFGKSTTKGSLDSKSPFGGEMPTKSTGPSPFEKAPLKGSPDNKSPFGGPTTGMQPKIESKSFGNVAMKGSVEKKSPFGGGGMPSKTKAPSPFGKAPLKGGIDSKSPFGSGGGLSSKTGTSPFGKAPKMGGSDEKSSFTAGMPPKSGSSFGKAPSKESTDIGGVGMPTKGAAQSSFGKTPQKGASTFTPGMPSKSDSAPSPKSFAKASMKKAPSDKNPFGGGIPGDGGPAVGMPIKSEYEPTSKSFGEVPMKGATKKGPFGGKDFMSKESVKGPFGKSLSEKGANAFGKGLAEKKSPFGGGPNMDGAGSSFGKTPLKGPASPFGKAPIKGVAEKKGPFGGGGVMPSKAKSASFGKAPTKGAVDSKGSFGSGGTPLQVKSASFRNAPTKGTSDSKASFGGGGMPPKMKGASPFGKAPVKGPAEKKSPFGGVMPSKAKSASFGNAPVKGSAEKKSPFGGVMPSKAKSASFGNAPVKGPAERKSPFGGSGTPSKAKSASFGKAPVKGSATTSFGKAPLKGAASGGTASFAPMFPNKGGIVAESGSSFVAKDILLDSELGRGSPEIRSDEPPPSSMPPPPKATSNRRPVFGLGGAFGKSTSRPMPPKGTMPSKGFSSVSPPNKSMPTMKESTMPPQQNRPGPSAPFDSGMNQPPPQLNRPPPQSNIDDPTGGSMRQPMADNFAPNSRMDTNQFADGRPARNQQQPPRQNFSQPPPQGPADWKNQASPSPIGQFSNSVRDPQRAGGTRLGSLASNRQPQQPPGTARPNATGPFENNDQQYSGGSSGPDDYQEVTVTDPRTGDRRTIRVPPPNPNRRGN